MLIQKASLDLAAFNDFTPALTLAVGERNRATVITLQLQDADGTGHNYKFNLRALKPGLPQKITADYGGSLAKPEAVDQPGTIPGLGPVVAYLLIGDWSGNAVDVVLSGIELVPPTDALRAERATLLELKAREAEKARRETEAKENARRKLLETGAPHPVDGPEVKQVCAVAPDVIAITVQAGKYVGN